MAGTSKTILRFFPARLHDGELFWNYLLFYSRKKTSKLLTWFELRKDTIVKFLLMKRGRYNRPFLHFTTMIVLVIGVIIGPFLADTYPIFSGRAAAVNNLPSPSSEAQSVTASNDIFNTMQSDKRRTGIIEYRVERGDTLSTIADKFSEPGNPISVDTIKWANDLTGDDLTVGDALKILPVNGVAYKVAAGDTVYSIAKKLQTNAQKIVDWPYNDFANPETFSLVAGQLLIVPDGVPPQSKPVIPQQTYYAATAQPNVVASGSYFWPVSGLITQTPSWYHMAYDIADPVGTPIVATKNGTVAEVYVGGWHYGYGTHVVISHGDGYSSLYAHMSAVNVSVGQSVIGGKTVVGFIGLTGRTTGAHVHFEIRKNDITLNPANFLR